MESPVWFQYTLNFFFSYLTVMKFSRHFQYTLKFSTWSCSTHLEIFNTVFHVPWSFRHTLNISTHFQHALKFSTHLETRFSIFSTLYVLWMLWIQIPTGVTEILVLKLKLNWYRSVRYSLNDWIKQFWFCNNYKT